MKQKILLLIIALLVVNITISALIFFTTKQPTQTDKEVNTTKLLFLNQISTSVENDNTRLVNLELDDYLIRKGIHSSPVLVIKYSFFGCKSCIDYIAAKIKEQLPDYQNNSSVLFIASDFDSLRSEYGCTLALKDNGNLGLPFDITNIPYVFIYDQGDVKHFFVPDTSMNDAFLLYLKGILEKYQISTTSTR